MASRNTIISAMNSSLSPQRNEQPSAVEQEVLGADVAQKISSLITTPVSAPDARRMRSNAIIDLPGIKSVLPTSDRLSMYTSEQLIERIQSREARSEDFAPLSEVKEEVSVRSTEIIAAGRNYLSVNSETFGDKLEDFKNTDIESNKRFVKDPLRGRVGKYWTLDKDNRNMVYLDIDSRARIDAPYKFTYHEPFNEQVNSDFGRTVQWVDLKANKKRFSNAVEQFSRNYWSTFVRGGEYNGSTGKTGNTAKVFDATIDTSSTFFDHTYEMPFPFTSEELEDMQVPVNALTADILPEYNFYIKGYENLLARTDVPENTLPNMYTFLSVLSSEHPNPELNNLITLDGTLESEAAVLNNKTGRTKFDIKTHPVGQYYDLYSRQYQKAIDNGAVERLKAKYSNVAVPLSEFKIFQNFNDKKEMFPLVVDMKISTDRTTTFAEMLKDTNLSETFMTKVMNRVIDGNSETLNVETATETIVQKGGQDNKSKNASLKSGQHRSWNVAVLLEDLRRSETELIREKALFLGEHENEVAASSGPQYKFFNSLMFVIFMSKLQTLISQKMRTFKQMMDGKKAYSETVLYRVAKHEFNGDGEPIQNFWLPNSNEIDVFRFIDTQVKYNKKYVYKVWAYQLVIGTKYEYSTLEVDSYDHHASVMVHQEPDLRLVETLFLEQEVRVVDKPPVQPDVDFIPFKGYDNKMELYLKGNVGSYEDYPVFIEPSDQAAFSFSREAQKRDVDEKLAFASDDHPSIFEIFRIEQHPASYADFAGSLRARVDTDVDLKSLQGATSVAYVDGILPNIKYYYTFRSIDVHGQISNPTAVFELEMINENGLIFPLVRCVEFRKEVREQMKPARRFVQLVPNVLQTLINEEKSGYDLANTAEDVRRSIHLGVVSDALWGKRFKMRLISKATGKKVEVYFTFEHRDSEKA